jgi:plasmid stability protein
MFCACANVVDMSKMIQIRNVPDDLHRRLKIRATEHGMSLSEYLLRVAERDVARPTVRELTERIRRRHGPSGGASAADLVRQARDGG